MSITVSHVVEVLERIIHPETEENLISSGIAHDIVVEGEKIKFKLTFKRPNDPLRGSIESACRQMIMDVLGKDLEVEIMAMADIKVAKPSVKKPKIFSQVKNVVAVASGKGGVGKSTVATNLAIAVAQLGYKVGLLDADIFGPSIPKMFNVEGEAPQVVTKDNNPTILPVERYGVKLLSVGFFVKAEDATVWRGPMASNALKQLMEDTDWGELDFIFVDMPPGTSDIHLTMVQEVAVTGAVIVTTPQPVALADAIKGINMFRSESINVPILGLVENMSWFTPAELPENKYYIFGKDGGNELALKFDIPLLGQIPLVQGIREGGDSGVPVVMEHTPSAEAFMALAKSVIQQVVDRNEKITPTKRVEIKTR